MRKYLKNFPFFLGSFALLFLIGQLFSYELDLLQWSIPFIYISFIPYPWTFINIIPTFLLLSAFGTYLKNPIFFSLRKMLVLIFVFLVILTPYYLLLKFQVCNIIPSHWDLNGEGQTCTCKGKIITPSPAIDATHYDYCLGTIKNKRSRPSYKDQYNMQ